MEALSKVYVNGDGELMCGHPDKLTSKVSGLRIQYYNTNDPEKFDYKIFFTNQIGVKCNGYMYSCIQKYYMK